MKINASAILEDIKLPDYKGRHVFTAKLRLWIFIVFWVIGSIYFKGMWRSAPWIPLVIAMAFLLTGICYRNILRNRALMVSFVLELAADLVSMTLIVYITGGTQSNYFTLYLMYCVAAGMFYNYQVAIVAAILSIFFYGSLVLSMELGWLKPFVYSGEHASWFGNQTVIRYANLLLLIMFLPIVVYAVKISNFFSRLKQRALEERNKQLVALNRISSTIRRMTSPLEVIQQVLAGVVEGLGYDVCLLVMPNRATGLIEFFIPNQNPLVEQIEARLGFQLSEMKLTPGHPNSIFTAIRRNRLVFRQELSELVKGVDPHWSKELADRVQEEMGFKKFVIMPLVAERRVIGALIGISRTEFVDETRIGVLENFSNQAALAIESAQLFEEIKNKNIELERANKIKSEFLAIMSHELRTPLTAIIGFSELLMEEVMGELNAEQKDSLREVINNGEHLLHLINSILDLAKVEAGKMELNLEDFSLEDLVQEVGSSVSPLLKKKRQHFELKVGKNLPACRADARKIRQILLNLLSNAIKFTPEEGSIVLEAGHLRELPAELSARAASPAPCPEGYFSILVRDTGIGIDPKDLKTVFNVFEQVDSSFTRRYQGTGLGLALTKQFVEMHQGLIWAESEAGKGSTFHLILPVKAEPAMPRADHKTPESIMLGAKQLVAGGSGGDS
ncbi:GAF domain-containing sensor histidine kinase [Deltaproteobacteria bacterium PRO3]|nr:GAF domain-containing sensor histidine kinase [Deltaproteobacteria bacterium PRO3]